MRHRHSGTYRSRTPKGRVVNKQRPIHSQALMNKHQHLRYPVLRNQFKISKYGDDDGDGVKNYKDCRPWDKKRQDEVISQYNKMKDLAQQWLDYYNGPFQDTKEGTPEELAANRRLDEIESNMNSIRSSILSHIDSEMSNLERIKNRVQRWNNSEYGMMQLTN